MDDTDANDGRIAADHYEPSPSTGPEETAKVMGVEYGLGAAECDAPDRDRNNAPTVIVVEPTEHSKDFLEAST